MQRLQELGNYRNLALLGLPVAREHWEALNGLESKLLQAGARVVLREDADDALLQEISMHSIELVSINAESSYRMSATRAYGTLVQEQLEELMVVAIDGSPSLTDFIRRRLAPALRTCRAFSERQAQMSFQSEQLVSLLRARVNTSIEGQNALILRSLERSAQMQIRLQQLVEGFSVVALTYYALSLLGYMVKGLSVGQGGDGHVVLAVLVPIVLVATIVLMKVMKGRALREHGR